MIIKSVKLTNFRNHSYLHLHCDQATTLILGQNGWGKTSILEAIYMLTRGKSFRATDKEILKHDADFYRIELEYQKGEKVTATYNNQTKIFSVSDQKTKRLPKKYKYPIVLFLPSDLNLISHSPGRRREYFDRVFAEFDDLYASALSKYNKALKQRNELLKKESLHQDMLFSWNILLAKYGSDLYTFRKKFIQEINTKLTTVYHSIADNEDVVVLNYHTELTNDKTETYLKKLENSFEKDLYLGHTTFGIHRDDYLFNLNHKLADGSASRGETRSIILSLKFIEAELIHQKTSLSPVVLLDDVFSELDNKRRHCLVKNFKDNQVILTSVEDISISSK